MICGLTVADIFKMLANIAVIIGVVGIYILYRQVRLAERASIGQNTISLITNLQQEFIRCARTQVIKEFEIDQEVKKEDEGIASTVISSYDIAAILIRNDYVDKCIFIDNFGPSIIDCFRKTNVFRKKMQENKGPRYWDDIEWLYKKAVAFHGEKQKGSVGS